MSAPNVTGRLYPWLVPLIEDLANTPASQVTNEQMNNLYKVYQKLHRPGYFERRRQAKVSLENVKPIPYSVNSVLETHFNGNIDNINAENLYTLGQKQELRARVSSAGGRSAYRRPTEMVHNEWKPWAKLSGPEGNQRLVGGRVPSLMSKEQVKNFSRNVKGLALMDFGFRMASGEGLVHSAIGSAAFTAVSVALPGPTAAYMLGSMAFSIGKGSAANAYYKSQERQSYNNMAVQRFSPIPTQDTAASFEAKAASIERIAAAQADRFSNYSVSRVVRRQTGSTSEVWSR